MKSGILFLISGIFGSEMPKVTPIIEYQEDIQRTPNEILDFLKTQKINRMFVIYCDDKGLVHIPGSEGRNYKYSEILFDMELVKKDFLEW